MAEDRTYSGWASGGTPEQMQTLELIQVNAAIIRRNTKIILGVALAAVILIAIIKK